MEKDDLACWSYSGNMGEHKTIDKICEKESLLDHNWLFNNIPWSNHDNADAKVSFDSSIEAYAIELNGYDTKTAKIKKFNFDNVIISAMHGFAGNSYTFSFHLGNDKTHNSFETSQFGFSVDELKNRYIDSLNSKIKGLKNQINYMEISIDKIDKLSL